MRTNDIDIRLLVSEDRWAKMKRIVLRLQAQVLENPEVDLCTHYFMSYRGTLRYGTQTYDHLTPYLKGYPNIMDYGWKVATSRIK